MFGRIKKKGKRAGLPKRIRSPRVLILLYIRAQGVGGGHNTRIETAVFFFVPGPFFHASPSSQGGFSAHFAQCSYAPVRPCQKKAHVRHYTTTPTLGEYGPFANLVCVCVCVSAVFRCFHIEKSPSRPVFLLSDFPGVVAFF